MALAIRRFACIVKPMDKTTTTALRIVESTPGTLGQLQESYANRLLLTVQGVLLSPADFETLPYLKDGEVCFCQTHLVADVMRADVVIVNNYDLMLPRVRAALDVILSHCDGDVILLVQPAAEVPGAWARNATSAKSALVFLDELKLGEHVRFTLAADSPLEIADVSGLVR